MVVERLIQYEKHHRDQTFFFVFDLFYEDGYEERAIELQEEMQELIDRCYNHGQERRLFWGTFGNTNMHDPSVIKMYYDSHEQYSKLQNLKKRVDPDDVFHTELTVQLP